MAHGSPDTEQAARMEREITDLETYCEELAEAIDDFDHEARRCRDRLERAGGGTHEINRELRRLSENRRLNRRELDKARRRIDALKAELARL
jgi:predicted RNase H-like nuclease (RuvC/YqgF family)